jgi:hypothetical protein
VSDSPSVGYYDLPGARDMGTQKVEWDLDPRWIISTLSGLSQGLSVEGAPLDLGGPGAIAGGIGGFIGLVTASTPQDQAASGVNVLQNIAGLGSKLAQMGSRAPVSVLAARLGAASTLLGIGSAWWGAISGGGAAIEAGVKNQELEGKQLGFLHGFAASLIGMDLQSTISKFGLGPGSSGGTPSQERAAQAFRDAFNANLLEGHKAGEKESTETAIAIVSESDRYATERDVPLLPNPDPEVALVGALVSVLPQLRDEMRAGTWEASSEQLQAADAQALEQEMYPTSEAPSPEEQAQALDDALYPTSEAATPEEQALDDALYPTSDAAPAEDQAQALDDALYPTSLPQNITEQEMSAPATADEAPAPQQAPSSGQEQQPASVPTSDVTPTAPQEDAYPTPQPEDSSPAATEQEAPASEQEAPASEQEEAPVSEPEEGEASTPEAAPTEEPEDAYPISEPEETPVSEGEEAPVSEAQEAPASEGSSEAQSGQEDAYPVSEPEDAYPVSEPEEAPASEAEAEPVAEEQPAESGGDGGGGNGG